MESPKVLVGCPTSDYHDYCVREYIAGLKSLSYTNFDILIVDNSKDQGHLKVFQDAGIPAITYPYSESAKERIIGSRNLLRKHCLGNGYEYLLSLEADVIPPKDIIQRLLSHQKQVVSGLYYKTHDLLPKGTIDIPLAYINIGENKWERLRNLGKSEVSSGQLFPVAYCGMGCILIHRNVLRQVAFRYKITGQGVGGFDDAWFGVDLDISGIPLYVDTSVTCTHLQDRPWLWNNLQK